MPHHFFKQSEGCSIYAEGPICQIICETQSINTGS